MSTRNLALGAAIIALVTGLGTLALFQRDAGSPEDLPELGLMSTLPIYWPETEGLDEMLAGDAPVHWARSVLEKDNRLKPLNTLVTDDGANALKGLDRLILAQPRPLSPSENVALDDWVRQGGHLLLFADPMLTSHSRFHIGDRRRPQDVVLLSPILGRWGLKLNFDEAQPQGERIVRIMDTEIPMDLSGTLTEVPTAPDAPAQCTLMAEGAAAQCKIGQGAALIIADAALLDPESSGEQRENALSALANHAFSMR